MIRIEHNIIGVCATNTYYVFNESTKEGFIVDPAGSPERIFAGVAKWDFVPKAILITHGHFDHILALDEVRDEYKIPAYIGKNEEATLHDSAMNLTGPFMGTPMTKDADVYLADGEEFEVAGYHIKTIETPGHTPGGVCYYIESEKVLFSGDSLFCESVGRTDFPGGSEAKLVRSVKEKILVLPEDVIVYPGHMQETSIGHEREYNPYC